VSIDVVRNFFLWCAVINYLVLSIRRKIRGREYDFPQY
jgi:hypothetical protein